METLSAGIRTHLPRDKTKGGDLNGPAGRATPPPGRHHPGTVGAIISEGWAKSFRAGGRHHLGVPGAIIPEPGARSFRIAGRHRPESADCGLEVKDLHSCQGVMHFRVEGKRDKTEARANFMARRADQYDLSGAPSKRRGAASQRGLRS